MPLILGEVATPRDSSPRGPDGAKLNPRLGGQPFPAVWGDGSFPSPASQPSVHGTAVPGVVKARLRANSLGIASQLPGARRDSVGDVGVMWDGGEGDSFPSLSC